MAEMMCRMDEVIFHAMVTNIGPRGMYSIIMYAMALLFMYSIRELECFGV